MNIRDIGLESLTAAFAETGVSAPGAHAQALYTAETQGQFLERFRIALKAVNVSGVNEGGGPPYIEEPTQRM